MRRKGGPLINAPIATLAAPRLVPPHIVPPAAPLGRLAFMAAFTRNPLEALPRPVYEQDLYVYRDRVWVTESSLIRKVLLDEREKYLKTPSIRLLGPLLGRGILTSEGAEWKWQRQASAPMFRHQDLLRFVPIFVRVAEALLERWRAAPAGSVHDVDRDMTRITFEVISATLLPSADRTVAPEVERSMVRFQRSAGWGLLYATSGLPAWLPRPGMISTRRAASRLRSSVLAMLRERRAAGTQPDDLMQRLMQARDPETGQSMDETRLVDNLLTFYLAGHETTARALSWTLYLLARSPEWSQQLAAGDTVAPQHLERLRLVGQFLKESMRLYPPVPIFSRQAMVDTELGGERVRAGMTAVIPVYAIHRHARRWADPAAFDPLRFAPEREAALERYQYMPFGAGPRICIGMSFAMLEATAMLATLLQRARFAPVDGFEPYPVARVTLLPRGGMPLRVTVAR